MEGEEWLMSLGASKQASGVVQFLGNFEGFRRSGAQSLPNSRRAKAAELQVGTVS